MAQTGCRCVLRLTFVEPYLLAEHLSLLYVVLQSELAGIDSVLQAFADLAADQRGASTAGADAAATADPRVSSAANRSQGQ